MNLERFLPSRRVLIAAGALLALVIVLPWLIEPLAAGRLRAMLHGRGLDGRWQKLSVSWPLVVELRGLPVDREADRAQRRRARKAAHTSAQDD